MEQRVSTTAPQIALGDARVAAEAIEAWLRHRESTRETIGVLHAMQARLVELGRAVQQLQDAKASDLYQDLGRTETMDQFQAGLDALAVRIATVGRIRSRGGRDSSAAPVRKVRTLIRL